HSCVICMDPIRGVEICAPCGDYYDKACLLDLFERATRDESLFPPRCCRKNIPLRTIQPYASNDFLKLFTEKSLEFTTLKRVYCSNRACSRFLGPQVENKLKFWLIRPTYRCPVDGCNTSTCTRCKAMVFSEAAQHICRSKDEQEDWVVLALGAEAGWARCPGCAQLIELHHGCYHMTCICRTEFCYLCRALWKTCTCPQWDEQRLLAAAEARADAELDVHRDIQLRTTLVQEWMERLLVDHDCQHDRWYRRGGGQCEVCGQHYRHYLFRCRACTVLVCNGCRKNRL
ncbi:hypothetical protein B0H21DRAFT_698139, partial [Amylocystis lapponica]